jgi:tripartite-type tricarboxylate transporter receptor subunit TctC
MRLRHWLAAVAAVAAFGWTGPSHAQGTSRPIVLVAPFAAGGGVDAVARILAEKLTGKLGQNVVVENRPGAGGLVGIDSVAKAAPDGHTILLMDIAAVLIKWLHKNTPFDVTKDFTPIAKVVNAQLMLFAHPSLPAKNVQEVIAYARANPDKLSVGIPGVGTPHHLAAAMFNAAAKLNITAVPYRGASPALNDLVGGQIPMAWSTPSAVIPFVQSGKVRPLAVATLQRVPLMPDVPTVAESGLPGFNVEIWFGVAAPKGVPADFVARINKAVHEALELPDVKDRLAKLGFILDYADGKAFGELVAADHVKYGKVIQAAGIAPK